MQTLLLIPQIPQSTVQFVVACGVELREKPGPACLFTGSKYWIASIRKNGKCPL